MSPNPFGAYELLENILWLAQTSKKHVNDLEVLAVQQTKKLLKYKKKIQLQR